MKIKSNKRSRFATKKKYNWFNDRVKDSAPNIILFDLETLPNLQEVLKVWPQLDNFPGRTMKATVTSIICAGYKYFGEKQTHCINAWDFPAWKKDVNNDKRLCEVLYDVLKDADCVITHNGKRFDWKFLNTRLVVNGLPPLHKIPHIDTCQLARSNLFLFSNRLDTLGEFLAGDHKMKHEGWGLWVKTYNKDPKALKKMEKYCKQDVKLLEKVYKILRPFAGNIPNFNLWSEGEKSLCPSCGSKKIKSHGLRHTKTKSYRRYRCLDCLSFSKVDLKGKNIRSIK